MTIEIAPSETQGSSDIKPAAAAGEVNMEGEQAKNSYESNQQAMDGRLEHLWWRLLKRGRQPC